MKSMNWRWLITIALLLLFIGHGTASAQEPGADGASSALYLPLVAGPAFCDQLPDLSPVECRAMLAVRESLNAESAWPNNVSPCQWTGVTCQDGHVVELVFHTIETQAENAIPPAIADLIHLQKLDLGEAALGGVIPSQLGSLTGLIYIDLSGNALTGTIPAELGNLVNLTRLDISHNPLSGSIPISFTNLTQLETFYYDQTGLCQPIAPSFQIWLNGVDDVRGTGQQCSDFTCSVITEITQEECEALVALRDIWQMEQDPWNNDLWTLDRSPCQWEGVACDEGHVLKLEKGPNWPSSYPNYTRTIPTHILNLSRLRTLDLNSFFLTGTIPAEIGTLVTLHTLDLGTNAFVGPIPPTLGQLTNLEYLSLQGNRLNGHIPSELGSLSNLTHLDLSINALAGTIPASLGNLTRLSGLYLYGNQLSGPLPPELGNLAALRHLQIRLNPLSGSIPLALTNLKQLETFEYFQTFLCEPDDPVFRQWLQSIPYVSSTGHTCGVDYCATTHNQVSPGECQALLSLRQQWQVLAWGLNSPLCFWTGVTCQNEHVVGLSTNDIQIPHAGPIPPQVGNLPELTLLALSDQQLTGSIPPELGNLHKLSQLYLDGNALSGSIPVELGNLHTLQRLDLTDNALTGTVPAELANLVALKTLNLSNNPLQGSLPRSFTGFTALEEFRFDGTNLCEPDDDAFQNWLESIPTLARTYQLCSGAPFCAIVTGLSQNECTAMMALREHWNLQVSANSPCNWEGVTCGNGHVKTLTPKPNADKQTIPPAIGDLAYLETLDLNSARLAGPIPPELGKLANLVKLELGDNDLTGTVPVELGNLTNLEHLSLQGNELTGAIPAQVGNLANLKEFYLSSNQLSGGLPEELGKLAKLEWLSLADNQLSGAIPPALGNLPQLIRLQLNNNALAGPIPATLGNLTNLEELALQFNQLSGVLPPELGNMASLRWMHINDNPLSGAIPLDFTQLAQLVTFVYANTDLCAPPNPEFQAWLDGLDYVEGTGIVCSE